MYSVEKYTFLKFFPSRQEMLNHLSHHGAAAVAQFEAGRYQSLFDDSSGQNFDSEVAGWAKAYVDHRSYLERATRSTESAVTLMLPKLPADFQWTLEQKRLDCLQEAAHISRKTIAGVATGISRQFEDFIAEYTQATAPFPHLAKTAEQVRVMREARQAASLSGHPLRDVLVEAESLDDFLLFALAQVLSVADEDKDRPLEYRYWLGTSFTTHVEAAREYQHAAHGWLGRSRKSTVIAISLAATGATVAQVRAFAESGIPREYAAVLTART